MIADFFPIFLILLKNVPNPPLLYESYEFGLYRQYATLDVSRSVLSQTSPYRILQQRNEWFDWMHNHIRRRVSDPEIDAFIVTHRLDAYFSPSWAASTVILPGLTSSSYLATTVWALRQCCEFLPNGLLTSCRLTNTSPGQRQMRFRRQMQ